MVPELNTNSVSLYLYLTGEKDGKIGSLGERKTWSTHREIVEKKRGLRLLLQRFLYLD